MVTLRNSNGNDVYTMLAIFPLWFLPMVPIAVLGAIIITVMPNWLFPKPQLSEYAGE